jgi:hypothetical protein
MTTHVILERSHHGPRLVGTFTNTADAEALRADLIDDNPAWEESLTIVGYDDSHDGAHERPPVAGRGTAQGA